MKIVIQLQINEETILDIIKKNIEEPVKMSELAESFQIQIGAAVKKEFAKTIVQICKDSKIPLGDLLKSGGKND